MVLSRISRPAASVAVLRMCWATSFPTMYRNAQSANRTSAPAAMLSVTFMVLVTSSVNHAILLLITACTAKRVCNRLWRAPLLEVVACCRSCGPGCGRTVRSHNRRSPVTAVADDVVSVVEYHCSVLPLVGHSF